MIHPKQAYQLDFGQKQKIAVIGSGISGIASAWFLSQKHQVTLFEKNDYLGGHTHTVSVEDEQKNNIDIDTGFIVYNEPNYPHLTRMFKHLGIKTIHTDMSFSVSIDKGRLEYSGNNLNTLFAQRKNLLSIQHWQMLGEIIRFNRLAKLSLNSPIQSAEKNEILNDFLDQHRFSQKMVDHYLLPMAAAIWSCPTETMKQFPARSFLQFFQNHGLLSVNDRPQWQTVLGGSHHYLKAIVHQQTFQHHTHSKVTHVMPITDKGQVEITTENGIKEVFDHVVLACHGDESRQMIDPNFRRDFQLLSAFQYQKNIAYLHTDPNLMPKNKQTWAAWNYLRNMQTDKESRVAVSYWMNLLQSLQSETQFFVTLNPLEAPAEHTVKGIFEYDHPVFDNRAMQAQQHLESIQGLHGLWFAGAYTGYGFHEDGLRSAVNIANYFDIRLPWQTYQDSAHGQLGIQHG